jgi:predicted phage terminase large subunit-like protein
MSARLLDAVLRTDLAAFIEKVYLTTAPSQPYVRNWHIELIADALTGCLNGKTKRLIINLPPRSLKSLCASVAFPAWVLGKRPETRIICASYSEELAGKHARDCRSIIESDWYKRAFPGARINPAKRSEREFETTATGYRLSTSLGGTLTGRGGSLIIIDDPLKPQDALSEARRCNVNQWYDNTLFSRLDNKETGCIIIVMQRVHIDDLVAHVQRNEQWTVLNLAALAEKEERFELSSGKVLGRRSGEALNATLESTTTLSKIRANIGSYNFSSQYQQEPVPVEGNIVKWEWFRFYTALPQAEKRTRILQSWDTAMKAHDGTDYSVCVTIREVDRKYYILDIYRDRLDFPALKKKVVEMKEEFGANHVIIEDKGSGTGLIQMLEMEGFPVIAYEPEGDKADRLVTQSALIEQGSVYLPENAGFLGDFRSELLSFPNGSHDDQVDALSQALDWLHGRSLSIFDVL